VFKVSENPMTEQIYSSFYMYNLNYLEMKDCQGSFDSIIGFLAFNRTNLKNLKELDVDKVEALDKHAADEDIETLFAEETDPDFTKGFNASSLLILLMIPQVEILNNELVPDKLRRKAILLSEKFADDY